MDTSSVLNKLMENAFNSNSSQNNQQQQNEGLGSILGNFLGEKNQQNGLGGVLGSIMNSGNNAISNLLSGDNAKTLATGLATSVLSSAFGSKGGGISGAMKNGGLATLSMIAYNAYQKYQENSAKPQQVEYPKIENMEPTQIEKRSQAILLAMIAAAKADGVIDEKERELLDKELSKLTKDASTQQWVNEKLNANLTANDVAALSTSLDIATQIFLMSILVINEANDKEKQYLDDLGNALKLDPSLQEALIRQIKSYA